MNATTAKMSLQILGILVGLTCLYLFRRVYFLASAHDWLGSVVVALSGLYFAYVGYLTWLRFSSRAIRHICGATLFWAFLISQFPIKLMSQDRAERGLLYIILFAVLIWVYRRSWRYFSGLIFNTHETKTAA